MFMTEEKKFLKECKKEINKQGKSNKLRSLSKKWIKESLKFNYTYHFEWLGRPIIQYPQDILGMQQLIWSIKPDLIIETGIARGGSVIFNASILKLIADCGGPKNSKVIAIDIDIRKHNKEAILSHPISKYIEMIEGSSVDIKVFEKVKKRASRAKKVVVFLDSNHSHDHVLKELYMYSQFVNTGSYLVVFDTIIEDLPNNFFPKRAWSKGNNPKTAVIEFLKNIKKNKHLDLIGKAIKFRIDNNFDRQLQITVSPGGFLKRI